MTDQTPEQAAMPPEVAADPKFMGTIDMLRRTGMQELQLRYHDDESPTVWMAVVGYGKAGDERVWEAAGALHPLTALIRVAEQIVDGSTCVHCHRCCGLDIDFSGSPFDDIVCWYVWDHELATFRRGCEGNDA